MSTVIRLAAGLAAATLLAAGCGPARPSGAPPRPATIPALASGDGATASMGLAAPAYPVPARVEYRVQGTLPSLATEAQAQCRTQVEERLRRLSAEELVYRPEVIFAVARR